MSTAAYSKHTWATREMITRDLLNALEDGVEANNSGIRDLETWQSASRLSHTGTVSMTNSLQFPFNGSKKSVSLSGMNNANYEVVILSATANSGGNIGEIEITERSTSGFKIGYTGSATSVTVTYAVIGGV